MIALSGKNEVEDEFCELINKVSDICPVVVTDGKKFYTK